MFKQERPSYRPSAEKEFDLKGFRETLYGKIQQFNATETKDFFLRGSTQKASRLDVKQDMKTTIPSFDELLKNMSSQKTRDKENQGQKRVESNRKLSGIQSKIEAFGQYEQQQQITIPHQRMSQRFSSQGTLVSQPSQSSFMEIRQQHRPVISRAPGKGLVDSLPLRELIELRSKIDQSTTSDLQALSANYVSELVKLAQVITRQVKKQRS